MKVVVVGGPGTIGRAVVEQLRPRHELISVGHTRGDMQVDITDQRSVEAVFRQIGQVDAIISVAGIAHFGSVTETSPEQFNLGLQNKLLGQVRLALVGQNYLNDGGSITLTSGILSHEPIRMGSNLSAVNAAIDSFVLAAAVELPRGLRINAVSPTMVTESEAAYGPFFPDFESVPAATVAKAFTRSVEGPQTGRVYRVWGG
jgi:NAD(P)-dependent dehydrogenase (short-subunit alcohol dehydrogenase family)